MKTSKILFPIILTISLFSLWAGFALLVVNKWLYKDLPGYQIGRICIWEFVALIVAALIAGLMINKWGNVHVKRIDGIKSLVMNYHYSIYFTIYFFIAFVVGVWQFWIFSQKF